MSKFKYEKLIIETAKALQCFIEEYKRDRPKFLENKNQSTPNNPQQPNITELTEDKIKLITAYVELNLNNTNNQKDFNAAVLKYIKQLFSKSSIKLKAGEGIKIDYDESDNSYTISAIGNGNSNIIITPKIKSLKLQSFK
jgi:hypothetical protein|nr:MAG TPA: hypothetical protein [Caudoviricetes sp.]